MRIFYLSCIFLLFSSFLFAQDSTKNMIMNPSFEQYQACPQHFTPRDKSHKLIPYWTYPTTATPDYFNRCSNGLARVPNNFAGTSEPKSGNGYMGVIAIGSKDQNKLNYREYIQGEIYPSMRKGKKYCVTFWYKLATYSKYAVDRMGLFFSKKDIAESRLEKNIESYLGRRAQVENPKGRFLDNKDEWQQICQVYVAKGNEQYVVIGNFNSISKTDTLVTNAKVTNKFNKAYSYYYIDDVSVVPLDNCRDCPCVSHDLAANFKDTVFTGGIDLIKAGKATDIVNDGHVSLKIKGGTPPYRIKWNTGSTKRELKNLPEGTYGYKVTDVNNCVASDSVTFWAPEIPDKFMDELNKLKEGQTITLKNIFFDFDKTTLKDTSYVELNKLVRFMIQYDIKLVGISGHTDSKGSDSYNQLLSEGRAKAVTEYLVSQGIDPERITFVGYGEIKPIATNNTDAGRALNRRVEFLLKKK